jgi:hypothetical protein
MVGLPDVFASTLGAESGTPANGTSFVSGSGFVSDLTLQYQGFAATYQLDSVNVQPPLGTHRAPTHGGGPCARYWPS